jgi:hypothetical protein
MDLSKYKSVKKGGAKKAAEIFESTRKKEPSDRLVKIISEIGQDESENALVKSEKISKFHQN